MSFTSLVSFVSLAFVAILSSFATAVEPYGPSTADITIVVMDPMAGPLACDCVQGYAQRKYERLADYLHAELKKSVRVVWAESLETALKGQANGKAELIIGKDSVVRSDAAAVKMTVEGLAHLTDMQGSTMQRGLFVVHSSSKASSLLDLVGHTILFGPDDCDEKAAAPKAILADIDVPYQVGEACPSCSIAAKLLKEMGPEKQVAAVISSYAAPLLEGCGTIKKGDLRIVGQSEEVPFIAAFSPSTVDASMRSKITNALLAMKSSEMLSALETKEGFKPYQPFDTEAILKKKP
jgi:ABC-type phosphate/phosphonate transport system substrate-binding protein